MGPRETLPLLHSPDGAGFLTGSDSGTGGMRYAVGLIATTLGAAELESHYAAQLVAAGWQRRDGGGAGLLAWSAWVVPDRLDWQAELYVVAEPGKGRRLVYLQAATDFVKAAPPAVLDHVRRAGNTVIT
jgi:hypothetical protein